MIARNAWLLLAACSTFGCGVPELKIIETSADAGGVRVDGQSTASDAGMGRDEAPTAPQPLDTASAGTTAADGGSPASRSQLTAGSTSARAGASGPAANGGKGGNAPMGGASASAAVGGSGGAITAAAAGSAGAPARGSCVVWKPANPKDAAPPDGAIEGGLEDTLTTPARQYICRVKPPGSAVPVPGKVMFGSGCFVVYRANGKLTAYSAMNEPIEVLTAAVGCSFNWKTTSSSALPPDVLELGDGPDDSTYACRGYNPGVLAQGVQLGHTYSASDKPGDTQCWFELLGTPTQPQDPTKYEVLTFVR